MNSLRQYPQKFLKLVLTQNHKLVEKYKCLESQRMLCGAQMAIIVDLVAPLE